MTRSNGASGVLPPVFLLSAKCVSVIVELLLLVGVVVFSRFTPGKVADGD
jgi:hypothetical protein